MFRVHKVSENLKLKKYKTYKKFEINIKEEDLKEIYKKNKSHKVALKYGFKVNEEHDAYVLENYGVYLQNVPAEIENINQLLAFTLKDGTALYKYLEEYINQGFNFVIGPAFPSLAGENISDICSGLYCKNYFEKF